MANPEVAATLSRPRSTFVTVVAWVFIVIAGMSSAIGLLQNVMLFTVFPLEEFRQAGAHDPDLAKMPAFMRFFMTHVWAWFLGAFVVSLTTLICAIGLLRRRNWARRGFVGIMVFGAVWCLVSPFLGRSMLASPAFGPQPEGFDAFMVVLLVFTFVFSLAMACVFGFIIYRLSSPSIRSEFVAS